MAEVQAAEIIEFSGPSSKVCGKCKSEKFAREFRKLRSDRTGLDPYCRDCRGSIIRTWRAANPEKVRLQGKRAYEPERIRRLAEREASPRRFTEDGQLCSRCRLRRPLSDFYRSARDKSGFVSICRECTAEKVMLWREGNQESDKRRKRQYHREAKYGISLEAFNVLLESQGDRCAICKISVLPTDDVCVDHSHETGRVRGILCRRCNTGLGMFKDSTATLRLAIDYLSAKGEV